MIDFLKESTFAVNEVLRTAWHILKKQYLSIAGLCFLLFVTLNSSAFLAGYLSHISTGISLIMALIFILIYFGLQLTLFKYTLYVIDRDGRDVSVKKTLPTKKQVLRFMISTFYFSLCMLFVFGLWALLLFPLVYLNMDQHLLAESAISLGIITNFIIWIRLSFFAFFIIDRDTKPFKAIRFSMAITRGNFTRLLLLLSFFAIFHVLSFYLNYRDLPIVASIVSIISSFFIVPLSSVALGVAYRNMMNEYQGDEDPDIIHNII